MANGLTNMDKFQFEKPENWTELVQKANTIEAYNGIVTSMFSDNIVNRGRLFILTQYTSDVCKIFPEIRDQVITVYLQFMNKKWQT